MSDVIDVLGQLWRSQVGVGRRPPDVVRPMAAVEYLVSAPRHSNLVKVENLSFLILYDEASRGMFPTIRFAAYRGARVPWGATWGGAPHCWIFKDLAVPPRDDGRGTQFDSRRPFLLEAALRLDRYLEAQTAKVENRTDARLCLPQLWAAFSPAAMATLVGAGPEFEAVCLRTGHRPEEILRKHARYHQGSVLLPMDWVSHAWREAVDVYAELTGFPLRQAFSVHCLPGSLRGFCGAIEYDFFGSYRRSRRRPPLRRRAMATKRERALV